MILHTIIALFAGSLLSGFFTKYIGYYVSAMITAVVFMSVGSGLITTFSPDTATPCGLVTRLSMALGLDQQCRHRVWQPRWSSQKKTSPQGFLLYSFMQQLGGAIFVAIGQNIFASRLVSDLGGVPGLDPGTVLNAGATDLENSVAPEFLRSILSANNTALTKHLRLVWSCPAS